MHSRLSASLLACALLSSPLPALAGTTPKKVSIQVRAEGDDGRVDLQGRAIETRAGFQLHAKDMEPPLSGEFTLLLRGATEDREVGRFIPNENGSANERYLFQADWREFLLGVESLQVLDGEDVIMDEPLSSIAILHLRAQVRITEGPDRPRYRLEGQLQRDKRGRARYVFVCKAERAQPAILTYRLNGPEGFFDIEVEVKPEGQGREVDRGAEDLLEDATKWTELIVLDGETELARAPLLCR
jgi:hypothetical protein